MKLVLDKWLYTGVYLPRIQFYRFILEFVTSYQLVDKTTVCTFDVISFQLYCSRGYNELLPE